MSDWKIFHGNREPHDDISRLPEPPPWRDIAKLEERRARTFQASPREIELVNAALYLRRPLLVTGNPGTGKSSLAHAVAGELKLGRVLRWSISSRSTLQDGLYSYDALARLRDAGLRQQRSAESPQADTEEDIGRYLRLGPLGTALLPTSRPRVLLIDEIDKSDVDLPNDLLHAFEEGSFAIRELERIADRHPRVEVLTDDGQERVTIHKGEVRCRAFPFVLLTSNGERELPPAFLRRCLRLDIPVPEEDRLRSILRAHLENVDLNRVEELLSDFLRRRNDGQMLATDQLLNAVFLVTQGSAPEGDEKKAILDVLFRELGRT